MNNLRRVASLLPHAKKQSFHLLGSWYSAAAAVPESVSPSPAKMAPPPPAPTTIAVSTPINEDKTYPPKLVKLVDEIAGLTLLEVADLNDLLKKTLKLPDMPMMGAMTMGPALPAPAAEEEEEAAGPVKVQTSFTVKLLKFDDTKKVALIKEVKSLLEGMNLVQAKKFVESAPTIVKADLGQVEAEKLMDALTAAGGTCEIV